MNMKKRILSLLLCLTLGLGVTACGPVADRTPDASSPEQTTGQTDGAGEQNTAPDSTPTDAEEPAVPVRFAFLSGPTGVGAVKLLADNESGAAHNDYEVTLAADNSEISAKLINGELDIACMASNVAANLYNKTNGDVTALCLSTLGVLYILERGEKGFTPGVKSISDLKGKTVYAIGQSANPQYVLEHLLKQNDLDPATDVEIIWKTAEEVQAALLTGDAQYAMLPVPAATAVQIKAGKTQDRAVVSVLDLTEEWNKVTNSGVLTMTTVVARTEFVREHPQAVAAFMVDYQNSIEYVKGNVESAAELVEQFGIVPSAAIAAKAIPDCNLIYITGEAMRDQIQGYYQVLFEANPAAIGGGIPDDAFYYMQNG